MHVEAEAWLSCAIIAAPQAFLGTRLSSNNENGLPPGTDVPCCPAESAHSGECLARYAAKEILTLQELGS